MTKTSSSCLVLTMCLASTMTSSRVRCQTAPLALPFSCCAVWLKQQLLDHKHTYFFRAEAALLVVLLLPLDGACIHVNAMLSKCIQSKTYSGII
ncbi:hypothetical protein BC831DRAFT_446085 [Entophlyctis helioformis]|nr:hypothetical protein BC831DRAFT_446085 [Entophlyctis helioformis]